MEFVEFDFLIITQNMSPTDLSTIFSDEQTPTLHTIDFTKSCFSNMKTKFPIKMFHIFRYSDFSIFDKAYICGLLN